MSEVERDDGVSRLHIEAGRWLSTGHRGGYRRADAASNLTVPPGFDRTDLEVYVTERLTEAGFESAGPALLTGVEMRHARAARLDSVTVVATVGLTNPATLPLDAGTGAARDGEPETTWRPGTVNLLVGTDRALSDGALASLLATAVEAKAATLQAATGFTGTTSDAIAVGCDPTGDPSHFAGSATAVGSATRACVRDALLAGIESRYEDAEIPDSVAEADHGVVTDESASVFRP
ncbi:adenosylcobinamide amidohydrolase [Halobacteriales archaeon Cl-PHB]